MNTFKYILYTLFFTQVVSAMTLATPKIIEIENNRPFSNTASVYYEDNYDMNTSIKVFNHNKLIGIIEKNRNPKGIAELSFVLDPNISNYLIRIQAINGNNESTLSREVTFSSLLKFQLSISGGYNRTVVVGQPILLDGKVWKGDLNKIDHYSWEENGELLFNTANDQILYWNLINSENAYIPKDVGHHTLKFIVTDIDGKEHSRFLELNVIKATALPESELYVEIRGILNLINDEATVKLGEFVALYGGLWRDKYIQIVESYHWEKDGEILKNMLGNDMLYWDVLNQENNDYKPEKIGVEHLFFVVKDIYGNNVSKEITLNVIPPNNIDDDYGDVKKDAQEIVLNETINGKKDYSNDHDFFVFRLSEKQHVKVQLKYGDKKVDKGGTLYTANELKGVLTHQRIAGSPFYKSKNFFLEAGTYYLDVSLYFGNYSLKIEGVN